MKLHWKRALAAALAAACLTNPTFAQPPDDEQWRGARAFAAELADHFALQCPVSSTDSQPAVDACRQGLYNGHALRDKLASIVVWGRQRDPSIRLKDASLTQLAPDALTGLYLPLFMFSGEHTVQYVENERLFQLRFRTAFRSRLQPGQFPYPFWHDGEKWSMYQGAKEIILWWDPAAARVKAVQFTVHGKQPPLVAQAPVDAPRPFNGQWMWTDEKGRSQPAVTVFDGLFHPENPYLAQLDQQYKALALRLREGQCDQCHVPNNPDHAKRLVLLQTPAHAAAEIGRLLKSVREDRMPRDEMGVAQVLDPKVKQALLEDGERFAGLLDAARLWEKTNPASGARN